MRDLDLMAQYLLKLRQERLQQAHAHALAPEASLGDIRICAHEAELCNRVLAAAKLLAKDTGQFIKEYLGGEGGERDE